LIPIGFCDTFELNAALIRLDDLCDHPNQGGFAGSIRTQQSEDGAGPESYTDIIIG
jgi:hypothetical protein